MARPASTSHRALLAALLLAAGCAERYPPPPETRVATVVDVLHGVEIPDDYRWLEDQDAPETRAWIAAQNAYAQRIVGEPPIRARFRARLRELVDRDDVGTPRRAGDFEYFTMRRAGEEAPRIHRRPAADDDAPPSVDEEYEVVLDPAAFDPSNRTSLSMVDLSATGSLMLYSIRLGGSDEIEVRVVDLHTGEDLPDRLPRALYSGLAFDDRAEGFYYTHRSRTEGPRIRHHTLGTDPTADELIWGEGYGPEVFVSMNRVDGDRYRIFGVQHGWARNDLYVQDRARGGAIEPVVVGVPAHFQTRWRDGTIWVLTDWDAPNYRLMAMDPARPDPAQWREVIGEAEDVLLGYTFLDERIYATYLVDVEDRVRVFALDGTPEGELDVPPRSTVGVSGGEDGAIELSARGYLRPEVEYALDPDTGERKITEEPDVPFDPDGFAVTKLWYESGGGRRAPVYALHRAGIELDGSHPTVLSGYGGFNSPTRPGFSTLRAAWVEAGGVWAVATLRGGREYGETWHRDGMLENKQNVFDDFIAAAETLVDAGYTRPDRLGISGGSNGGLLVAAAMTQRPDLFRAVLCTYPDLDMVRFYTFSDANNMPALLEYGDARDPAHFAAIRRYSPYQAVLSGMDYPAVMLTTGDLDTRVPPLQARKMTARLQAATASRLPVLLWYDEMGGHAAGRGRPMSLRIEDGARELTFLATQLGLAGA